MSRVVRSDEVEPEAWANGGGTTRELARADDGSWRISLADVEADGPFSAFPGRHRLLTVVDGPVLDLEVDGEPHVVEPTRPFAFSGDAAVVASVPEGAVRALNVIVDPAVVAPFVTVLELGLVLGPPARRGPGGVRRHGGRPGQPGHRPGRGQRPLHGRGRDARAHLTHPCRRPATNPPREDQ